MRKQERQMAIRELLRQNNVERQEEIVALLRQRGIEVTQATISRDVKEMQLIKLPSPTGEYRYSFPAEKKLNTEKKLRKTLRDAYLTGRVQGEFLLLKVSPGNGPVISSLIEQMKYEDIFGTLGDDDTILVIAKTGSDPKVILQRLLEMIE
ncbi:arginine repressor [Liquorilactobacillus satsumensis]|nr:arginine repressor [Liquorilactobacillus satsumensis]MCC7665873.1 ArgR family transcriptional regulator [Liquorilactobacillus satsumensis]MCP9312167.1 arginine repressor [Liquorilactobacillus satsumensis]MCP9327746.1 arginine repressor [Liquorilactobacillus satsumensis]MCP9356580.1 arginine repressor [Liquorilactobacillus satsumensis]MCP9359445.1 arginine repressor [Liquorilactobacillus satsumensis]